MQNKYVAAFVGFLLCIAADAIVAGEPPAQFSANYVAITDTSFKKAAIKALLQRDWEITSVEANKVIGTHQEKDVQVAITRNGNVMTIGFVNNSGSDRWIANLKKDLLVALVEFN